MIWLNGDFKDLAKGTAADITAEIKQLKLLVIRNMMDIKED